MLLCDLENKVLEVIFEKLGSPYDSVLCFDGIMISKRINVGSRLRDLEVAVLNKLNVSVELTVKKMDEGVEIP